MRQTIKTISFLLAISIFSLANSNCYAKVLPLYSPYMSNFPSSVVSPESSSGVSSGVSAAGTISGRQVTNTVRNAEKPTPEEKKSQPGDTPWSGDEPSMLLSDLDMAIQNGQVYSILLSSSRTEDTEARVTLKDRRKFIVLFPSTDMVSKTMSGIVHEHPDQHIQIEAVKSFPPYSTSPASTIMRYAVAEIVNLSKLIPTIILLVGLILLLLWVQLKGMRLFTRMEQRPINPKDLTVTFDDIAGVDNAKNDLKEVIDFMNQKTLYNQFGARIPKGVLLIGDPGNGKTMLAKAAAKACNADFYQISGSGFVELFAGLGAARVRGLFKKARQSKRSIIFIDEIDAVGRNRGSPGSHSESEQTLNQLLTEMDGFEQSKHDLLVIAATNRVDVLDEALLRPGRFDRHVVVEKPSQKGRGDILTVYLRKACVELSPDEISLIAGQTVGFSGADIANLVNESLINAASRKASKPEYSDMIKAREKILLGDPRRDIKLLEKERWLTAVHESGHGIIALATSEIPIEKITIVPRRASLGLMLQVEDRERWSLSKTNLESQIQVLMGGRAAEELLLGDITTGASNDMARAFDLAKKMVMHWGMGGVMGSSAAENPRDLSESLRAALEQEAMSIVQKHYSAALKILTEHEDSLTHIAHALMEKDTLERGDIVSLWGEHSGRDPYWVVTDATSGASA